MTAFNRVCRLLVPVLTVTVAAASALVLVVSKPASANATTADSSSASADVLFWSRSLTEGYGEDKSIVKASADKPSLVATVLASSADPYAAFSGPEASPDGTKLAYIRYSSEGVGVEVRDLATGSTTVLASHPNHGLAEPTWSPDGETIAYVDTQHDVVPHSSDVRVVAATGGPSRTVQDFASGPAWRRDGTLTVTRHNPENRTYLGLWITGATPDDDVLIPGSEGGREPAWSPDGTQVAFSFSRSGDTSTSIQTLPAAGGTPTVIAPAEGYYLNEAPVWSSDGRRIYFTQDDNTGHPGGPRRIMQVPLGGAPTVAVGGRSFSPSVSAKASAPVPSESHDFTDDGYADVIGRMSNGDLRVYYGDGLGLSGYRRIGTGWGGMTAILTPGDFNGDHHPDVIGRLPNGDLRLYTGVGGGPGGSQLIGTGWGGMTAIFSPGDFTGDGHPDVIARTATGELRLYFGTGTRLSGYRVIGTGWNAITAVFSPGDFNGDHHPDVIGRTTNGDLRVYAGTGTTLSGSTVIGTGWNGLSALFSPGDFTLDGRPDVIGRLANGDLCVYYGTGTRLSGYRVIGTGWNSVNPIL